MQSTYLDNWYTDLVGESMLTEEIKICDSIFPTLFGYHLLFFSPYPVFNLFQSSMIAHRVVLHPDKIDAMQVQGEFDALPFLADSVDVVMLAYLLEVSVDPVAVLTEAHRILRAEGNVVITGFNPWSFWGVHAFFRRLFGARRKMRYISGASLCATLSVLGFQITRHQTAFFRPPFALCLGWTWLERAGQRWWPYGGALYTIVAVKREIQLTPLQPVRKLKSASFWGACPVQQNTAVSAAED